MYTIHDLSRKQQIIAQHDETSKTTKISPKPECVVEVLKRNSTNAQNVLVNLQKMTIIQVSNEG